MWGHRPLWIVPSHSWNKKEQTNIYVWTPGLTETFLGSRSGRAALKDEVVGAVGEEGRKKVTFMKWTARPTADVESTALGKKMNGDTPTGYSGRTALRRELYQ
jgi:hypothetical protein